MDELARPLEIIYRSLVESGDEVAAGKVNVGSSIRCLWRFVL